MMIYKCMLGLLIGVMASSLVAEPMSVSVTSYVLPISYKGAANKTNQTVMGGHAFFGVGLNHSVEVEIDRLMEDSSTELQTSFLGKYTNYSVPTFRFWGGYHLINPRQDASISSDQGKATVLMGGVEHDFYDYYGVKRWVKGVDVYLSEHETSVGDVSVVQISPKWKSIIYPWQISGVITTETKINAGFLSTNVGFESDHFVSIEETFTYTLYPFTVTATLWAGEEQFSVRSGGAAVYNVLEKHLYGLGTSVAYNISPKLVAKLGYFHSAFRQVDQTKNSTTYKLLGLVSYTF